MRAVFGDGLFSAESTDKAWWKAHRLLVPAFGPVGLSKMFGDMQDISAQLILKWDRFGPEQEIELIEDMSRLTFDTIGLCAFGYRFNEFYTDGPHPFMRQLKESIVESGKRANRPDLINLLYFRRDEEHRQENIVKMRELCRKIIQERLENPRPEANDLLNVMLNGVDRETGEKLGVENVIFQIPTLLGGGYETTSSTLCFIYYFLCNNPDKMRKAREEVDRIVGDSVLNYDMLRKLKYLDAVMKEALRLQHPVSLLTRFAVRDTVIRNKYLIKKGQTVSGIWRHFHRDPDVWGADADEFRPERMLDVNFSKLPTNAWKPFGDGLRACIGRGFAEQEILINLAMVLQKFDIEKANPEYHLQLTGQMGVKPVDFRIRVRRRSDRTLMTGIPGGVAAQESAKAPRHQGQPQDTTPRPTGAKKAVSVFFGGNQGTCESLVDALARMAPDFGLELDVRVLDEATENLPNDRPCVIITPSYEGRPPDNAKKFVAWVESLASKGLKLPGGTKFAVFGVGNSDWVHTFHRIPILIDESLEKLGAERIIEAGFANVKRDLVGPWEAWSEKLCMILSGTTSQEHPSRIGVDVHIENSELQTLPQALASEEMFTAVVTANLELADATLGPAKRHTEVRLPAGCEYRSGDYLVIQGRNSDEAVTRVMKRFRLTAGDVMSVRSSKKKFLPVQPMAVEHFLRSRVELAAPISKRQLETLASFAKGDTAERIQLEKMLDDACYQRLLDKRYSVIDVLEEVPQLDLPFGVYIDFLLPLAPRVYSLSSSPMETSNQLSGDSVASVTFDVFEAEALSGHGTFRGVASSYLASRMPGDSIVCCIRPTKVPFHLPPNPETPIIMVAAGTGIAPMRAFCQERAAIRRDGRQLGPALLFFGCRHPEKDYLYRSEFEEWDKEGIVEMIPCFSRPDDGRRCYVSDALWEQRERIWAMFEDGARVYTCGSAGRLGLTKPKTVVKPSRTLLKSEPISFGQSRFWFLRLLLDDQTTSNVAFYYHITGDLRIGDMERAIRVVTARHEALRTCFVADETQADRAYQNVMSSSPLRLERKDIHSVEDVATEYANLMQHSFDLESGDLIRLVLLSLSPTSHYLLVSYHHILMDGVSFQVFLSDLEKAYKGESLGAPPQQFPAFSAAQRKAFETGEMKEELRYWQGVFPAGEQPPVLPLLPMARTSSRVAMKNFDVHQVRYRLEPALAARVKSASKTQRSTPFHFYLAAFKAMLFSFTDAQDLTIGIADANRTTDDLIGSIGFFLNLLALRFRRQPDQSFKDAIAEARSTTYAALAHSRLPFDVLLNEFNVARSSTYSPFFQAFFDYRQGAQEKHAWGNTQFEFQEIHPGRTSYDITLDITDNPTDGLIMLRVQKSLYDITAANLLLETYVHFLDTLSTDVLVRLQDTPLFGEKQLAKAITIGRGPDLVSDWPSTLPHRIDQVAQSNPDKVALVDGLGKDLTYSDMINRIEAIAEALQGAGVGPGSRVLVFQTAASDWVCSMLAIMRTGAIYVPLDLRNPVVRLASVAVDCAPDAVLADHTTLGDAPRLNVPSAAIIDVSSLGPKPSNHVPNCAQADSPAAILYTSGSTGVPKGIVVTHSGLRNEIEGYTKTWELGAERTLQQSAFTFNHSSDQIYTGLVNGSTVYIVPWSKRGDPIEITKIIKENAITYTKATPSEYSLWMQFGGENLGQCTEWSRAFGGGEPLTSIITQQFAKLELPQLRVYNSYGPTEISISSTKMEVDYRNKEKVEDGRIPCGYSLPNYQVYVVDEQLKPLPAGMPGELCIGGAGVALGYLDKELTGQHFIASPFASPWDISHGWTRMYRTGDICHLQDDGAMVFHNRMAGDTQVKIRGIRIELSDIESNIISTAGGVLKEAVVTLREGDPDFLVAHVVFERGQEVTDQETFLQQLLSRLPIPQYMIPVIAIPLETLPLTNHSKVDRKALKSLPLPQRTWGMQSNEELTGTMTQLKQIWQDVLGNSGLGFEISPSTSFFSVGGNSLLVIRLQQYIRQVFSVEIRLVELLGANTLAEMARKIDESIQIEAIDWEEETRPPSIPDFLKDVAGVCAGQQQPKTLLVTGATGYIAKYLLPKLAASRDVQMIYCVAVRDKKSQLPRSSKIVSYEGDLTAPQLGLSDNEFRSLSSKVDIILHMGAVRSFWDNYHVLRPSNVHPTRELVKLATPRRIPIHYISTVSVLSQAAGIDTVSAASCVPAVDGTNGYVASRWASERILERAAESLGVPASIYRFLPSAQSSPQDVEVLDEFARYVDVSGVMPDMSGWDGRIDMAPAEQVATWLSESVLADVTSVCFSHYESQVAVDVGVLREYLEEKKGGLGLERMAGLKWIGRIKALGFGYFLTAQDVAVGREGEKYESRR